MIQAVKPRTFPAPKVGAFGAGSQPREAVAPQSCDETVTGLIVALPPPPRNRSLYAPRDTLGPQVGSPVASRLASFRLG
jgi:hypothetical protein